jgi:hypothetical protein
MPEAKTAVDIRDESRLAQLGYKQELKRDWKLMHNFGVSFSIIVRRNLPPTCGNKENKENKEKGYANTFKSRVSSPVSPRFSSENHSSSTIQTFAN